MEVIVSKLTKSFDNNLVLKDIDFSVSGGDILGVIGKNGIGKSTMLNILCGSIVAENSTILLDNVKIDLSSNKWKSNVGFVSDQIPLIDDFSPWEFLLFIGNIYKLSNSEIISRVNDLYEFFFQEPILKTNKPIKSLSTGMKKKIQLISSIIHKPSLLILDEPFSGLDSNGVEKLSLLLKKYSCKDTIIIFTSHDIAHHRVIANKWLLLEKGVSTLFNSFDLAESFYNKNTSQINDVSLNLTWL